MQNLEDIKKRAAWFLEDRFGIFIHFGLYAIPGRGEWIRNREKMTIEDYKRYFERFNPIDFDAKRWAKDIKKSGAKYVVLTAKHHDGFCLFDSQYTDYKSTKTPFGRDLVREFLEAARQEGLKVGLYFSLIDWYHPDFPKYEDRHHPMRANEAYKNEEINFDNYLDFMHKQVEELVTNYGKLDIMWFDFSYDDMTGQKWRASELVKTVRQHQPDILIDNRLEGSGEDFGSFLTDEIKDYAGDFINPEQALPFEGIRNNKGDLLPWELCLTMNYNWGYHADDTNYKSAKVLIRKLVECVSKGGNLLLNVGPDARGNFPDQSLNILAEIGQWMALNAESIYGASMAAYPKPEWGYYTQNKDYLYAHIFDQTMGPLPLVGIDQDAIDFVDRLADYAEVQISSLWSVKAYDETFLAIPEDLTSRNVLNDIDTVLRIKLR